MAARDVDDRKAPHPNGDIAIMVDALIVGTTMRDRIAHPLDALAH